MVNNSLLKALDLLGTFSPEQPEMTLSEISRELAIPKSTAHRILQTLQARGFIERAHNDAYALGTNIIALTQAVRVNVEIRDRAATVARSLAERCRESVYVAVPEDTRVLYIYAIETSKRLRARTAVGDRAPLYCTGIGKACLAFLPPDQRAELIGRLDLAPFTKHTIVTNTALATETGEIVSRGYATDQQEHELGTYCVAAPFRAADRSIAGAISISGSDPNIIGTRQDELAGLVTEAASRISNRLGYVASRPSIRA